MVRRHEMGQTLSVRRPEIGSIHPLVLPFDSPSSRPRLPVQVCIQYMDGVEDGPAGRPREMGKVLRIIVYYLSPIRYYMQFRSGALAQDVVRWAFGSRAHRLPTSRKVGPHQPESQDGIPLQSGRLLLPTGPPEVRPFKLDRHRRIFGHTRTLAERSRHLPAPIRIQREVAKR
jgi:hypothetical protein